MRKAWSVSHVCLAICLVATAVGVRAQRYSFEGYDQHNGLSNLALHCILQDKKGLLWVGTEAGIFRFNGYRFEHLPTPEGDAAIFISGMAEDGRGRIWYSTSDSLGYFEGAAVTNVDAPGRSSRSTVPINSQRIRTIQTAFTLLTVMRCFPQ